MKRKGLLISSRMFVLLCTLWLGMLSAQAITTTVATTTSICFNDGTLTLSSTGGTAPYTYTITSGPVVPGIAYPYSLPAGQSTFSNLAAGTYTGTVRDALGATGTFTATVGGTYTFPTMLIDTPMSPWLQPPVLQCHASGGLPLYEYAISTTGPNAGFVPYQSSPVFAHICPATYWVRVRDACGNIFTDSRHFDYQIGIDFGCLNFSRGMVNVSGIGNTPLTYTLYNANTGQSYVNHTGTFPNVGAYDTMRLTVTDSCGVTSLFTEARRVQRLLETCPFDGNVYGHIEFIDTMTLTCTNCVPVQTVVKIGSSAAPFWDTIFRGVPQGLHPDVVVTVRNHLTCGTDTIPPLFIAPAVSFMQLTNPRCNAIRADVYSGAVGMRPQVDSFVIVPGRIHPTTWSDSSADFTDLPNGGYTVIAYLHPGQCPDSLTNFMSMPAFGIGCYQHMKDSVCDDRWQLGVDPIYPEKYSIINAAGDTTPATYIPGYSEKFFYDLVPATNYTVISDSGCALPLTTQPFRPPVSEISYVSPCTGPPVLTYSYTSYNFCVTQIKFKLWHNGALAADTTWGHSMIPDQISLTLPDSGLYSYKFYVTPYVFTPDLRYDSICPLDTGSIYIVSDHRPRLMPAYINICDTTATDSLYFHVAGGLPPYIVEIPGVDTLYLSGHTGVFPSHHPGTYAMIVYDDCGVSRSLSLSVIDTCHGCPMAAIRASDTLVCLGDSVVLYDISAGGVVNEWQIDGLSYSTGMQTTYTPPAGTHDIILISGAVSGCLDTAAVSVRAVAPATFDLGSDTVYCDTFSRVVSTGISGTVWSTGDVAAQISVHQPGLYIATTTDICGVHRDSVSIQSRAISDLHLSADSGSICSNIPDSILLTATIDSLSGRPVTFAWSTGSTIHSTYSAGIWVHTAGTYQVSAHDGQCSASASATVAAILCDTSCLSCPDTSCAGCPDTACISRLALPDAFSPNGDGRNDLFYIPHTCTMYSYNLRIYDRWGGLVYESKDITKGWDGTYKGKPQPADSYTCLMCAQDKPSDPVRCREWTLILIR
ncbi:MAG: gliding motility-associated C-terminal domain-containing protein [Bacteroidetes bacterium]|nr:gliding motility-associated C-terminal domain-containing protein [Bacteroidota bacterium]